MFFEALTTEFIFFQLYERRTKHVAEQEKDMWAGTTHELMSDEEESPDSPNTYVRRTVPWRSERLSTLMRVLDERIATSFATSKTLYRQRVEGPPSTRRPSSSVLGYFKS